VNAKLNLLHEWIDFALNLSEKFQKTWKMTPKQLKRDCFATWYRSDTYYLLWDTGTRASIFFAYSFGQNFKLGCFRVGEIRSWRRPFGPNPTPTSRYDCTLILNLEEGSRDSDLLARASIYRTFRSGPFCTLLSSQNCPVNWNGFRSEYFFKIQHENE